MNYAAVLKPNAPALNRPAPTLNHLKEGWVNLRAYTPGATSSKKSDAALAAETLDARLKEAAVTMRRRWDRWNADHGIDYDYDRECSCSDGSSDDDGEDGGYACGGDDDAEFDRDYQYIKKTTLVTH
jgi:hypothetical protein